MINSGITKRKRDAAIEAGYKPSRARYTGRDLATYSHIIERREELSKLAESDTTMSVKERYAIGSPL